MKFFNFHFPSSHTYQCPIEADCHAHLISDIDDGPKTLEESIQLIEGLQSLGIKSLIATPHIYQNYYPNRRTDVLDKFHQLQQHLTKHPNIKLQIKCAAEYYLDNHFEQLLEQDELLTLDGRHILVETSFISLIPNLYELIFRIQTKGYVPLLAHPERYSYLRQGDYDRLIERGCKFQVNVLSFSGHYGKEVKKAAYYLLQHNYIDRLGTDAHHLEHVEKIRRFFSSSRSSKLLKREWPANQL